MSTGTGMQKEGCVRISAQVHFIEITVIAKRKTVGQGAALSVVLSFDHLHELIYSPDGISALLPGVVIPLLRPLPCFTRSAVSNG